MHWSEFGSTQRYGERLHHPTTVMTLEAFLNCYAAELGEHYYNWLSKHDIDRVPIIGLTDGSIHLQLSPRASHFSLWNGLNKPRNIAFTSSLEGVRFMKSPEKQPYLTTVHAHQDMYIQVGLGSSSPSALSIPNSPLGVGLTPEGKTQLAHFFRNAGVSFTE